MEQSDHYAILKLLCGKLWSFRKNGYLCDTTVVTKDRELPAHSIVLAAGSSSFHAAFPASPSSETKYRIVIPYLNGDIIEAILYFIYNGCLCDSNEKPLNIDNMSLLQLCEQFGVCWVKETNDRSDTSMNPIILNDLEWSINGDVGAENLFGSFASVDEAIVHFELLDKDQFKKPDESVQNVTLSEELHDDPEFTSVSGVTDEQTRDKKPVMCEICCKCFDDKLQLDAHSEAHVVADTNKPYACDLCPQTFRRKCKLKEHCQNHDKDALTNSLIEQNHVFVCDSCDKTFINVSDLKKHKKIHKSQAGEDVSPSHVKDLKAAGALESKQCLVMEIELFDAEEQTRKIKNMVGVHVCEECGKTFRHEQTLVKHSDLHNKDACYVCCVCEQGFTQQYYLQKHLRRHTDEPKYKCNVCGKAFKENYLLRKHAVIHAPEKPFMCDICNRAFGQEYYLKKHRRRHTVEYNYSCEYCGRAFKENYQLKKHTLIHIETMQFPCGTCNRMFRNEKLLQKHRSIHEEGASHSCEVCGKTFKVRTSLNAHRKLHNAERHDKKTCRVCGLVLASAPELRRHEAAAHALITPSTHQCFECGKLFMHAAHLSSHLRTHSNERPHACPLCQRSFRRQADMRSHLLTHTGQKSNLCSVCGKGFLKKSDLKRHFQGHAEERPYVCDTCGKGFKLLNYLREHLFTHATEKAFACPICKKAFNSVGNMKNHQKIHSGLKPHKCPLCGKEFLRPANLRSHVKVHVKRSEVYAEAYSPLENLVDLDKYALSDASQISEVD